MVSFSQILLLSLEYKPRQQQKSTKKLKSYLLEVSHTLTPYKKTFFAFHHQVTSSPQGISQLPMQPSNDPFHALLSPSLTIFAIVQDQISHSHPPCIHIQPRDSMQLPQLWNWSSDILSTPQAINSAHYHWDIKQYLINPSQWTVLYLQHHNHDKTTAAHLYSYCMASTIPNRSTYPFQSTKTKPTILQHNHLVPQITHNRVVTCHITRYDLHFLQQFWAPWPRCNQMSYLD